MQVVNYLLYMITSIRNGLKEVIQKKYHVNYLLITPKKCYFKNVLYTMQN